MALGRQGDRQGEIKVRSFLGAGTERLKRVGNFNHQLLVHWFKRL
jgi:hypothetical protein